MRTYTRSNRLLNDRLVNDILNGPREKQYIVSAEAGEDYRLATFSTITGALLYADPLAELGYRVIITTV